MRRACIATVSETDELAPGIHRLRCQCADLPPIAPGQFVFARIGEGIAPLLRRPFGVHHVDGDTLELLFDVVGAGTRHLARLAPGDRLDLLLPLGRGWPEPPGDGPPPVLVAGGLGLPPLHFLAGRLHAAGRPFHFVYGAANAERLVLRDAIAALCPTAVFCTDDGSAGVHGMVTANLPPAAEATTYYACGPTPMMRALARQVLAAGHRCWVSLEERMACGVGVCMGCTCRTRDAEGREQAERACVEGPVFDAGELAWS